MRGLFFVLSEASKLALSGFKQGHDNRHSFLERSFDEENAKNAMPPLIYCLSPTQAQKALTVTELKNRGAQKGS